MVEAVLLLLGLGCFAIFCVGLGYIVGVLYGAPEDSEW